MVVLIDPTIVPQTPIFERKLLLVSLSRKDFASSFHHFFHELNDFLPFYNQCIQSTTKYNKTNQNPIHLYSLF